MKIFCIICTRSNDLNNVTKKLLDTLSSFSIHTKLLVNQKSIFEAYDKGLKSCDANPEDIVIFCHDDVLIFDEKEVFLTKLLKCQHNNVGIIGPAGTTYLGQDAVWWNHANWAKGKHKGLVYHVTEDGKLNPTEYGPSGKVVALDGLFLAARKEVWDAIGLEKPEYFEGNWDFYDIHYTTKSHLLGYNNYALGFKIIHQSSGEVAGRDSWHKNREAFINNTKLPLTC